MRESCEYADGVANMRVVCAACWSAGWRGVAGGGRWLRARGDEGAMAGLTHGHNGITHTSQAAEQTPLPVLSPGRSGGVRVAVRCHPAVTG
jgi:hypothetical protein